MSEVQTSDVGGAVVEGQDETAKLVEAATKALAEETSVPRHGDAPPVSPRSDPRSKGSEKRDTKDATDPEQETPTESESDKLPKLVSVLRAREKIHSEREKSKAESESLLSAARSEAEKIIAEAKAKATAEVQAQIDGFRSAWARSPLDAIRQTGLDKDKLVNEVVLDGSPEWAAISEERKARVELEKRLNDVAGDKVAKLEKLVSEMQSERETARRQHTIDTFLGTVPKDSPLREYAEIVTSLADFDYSSADDYIVRWADRVATQYHSKTGEVASFEEIVQYLEHEARERLKLTEDESDKERAPSGRNGATKESAQAPRTLSGRSASERRSAPKPISEMTPEEERAALVAAAEEAFRTIR